MTRGWILQELIAPRFLAFFSREWVPIGNFRKSNPLSRERRVRESTTPDFRALGNSRTFDRDIASITKIPLKYLAIEKLYLKASVARRMSWASSRQTTRIEDTAYCPLRIIDINMPLLYGEADKAFIRLQEQEEIMNASTDQSIFAWNCIDVPVPRRPGDIKIIAPSPSVFSRAGGIILCQVSAESIADTTLTLSNFGLSLRLRLFDPHRLILTNSFNNYVLCMLDCRLETQGIEGRPYLPLRGTIRVGVDMLYERCHRPSAPLPIFLDTGDGFWTFVPPLETIHVPRIRDTDYDSLWNTDRGCWGEHSAHDWTLLVLLRRSRASAYRVRQLIVYDAETRPPRLHVANGLSFLEASYVGCRRSDFAHYWIREAGYEYFTALLEVEIR